MLLRFVVNNVFSFGEKREFNMIPYTRLGTLNHHRYDIIDIELLKMASIYGANGAGKSNLIKALRCLQKLVVDEEVPTQLKDSQFKFNPPNSSQSQMLAIEFIQDEIPFYYAVEIIEGYIATEELYKSGLGKQKDELIFERKTSKSGITDIKFLEDFENDEKSRLLKSILIEEFAKPNSTILYLLSKRDNKFLKNIKNAFEWFKDTLLILTPQSKPQILPHIIDIDTQFKKYAEDLMCSFNLGITSLSSEKKLAKDFFGDDTDSELNTLINDIEKTPNQMVSLRSSNGDQLLIVNEDEKAWVKQLKVGHKGGKNNSLVLFDLEEESDGTKRLLDFVPALEDLITSKKVVIIDEIERSIHPLLIKELVKKLSLDEQTKGQLIFATHESNLLDQKIFRQDEIWFVEKDKDGSTDLYPLSEFKEHKTINIRKGYLNGRYGSIPFLGNLKDLNWQEHVAHE